MTKDVLNNWVSKSNLAVRFSQKFTLNEKRILSIGLAKFDSRQKIKQVNIEDRTFKITIADFEALAGTSTNTYRDMKNASKTMRKRYIAFDSERPISANRKEIVHVEINWLEKCIYREGGYVILTFTESILPHITELRGNFTTYKLKQAEKFRGLYSWDLLDILLSFRKKQHREDEYKPCVVELSVDELRDYLQIPESYKWDNIKRQVIDNSAKELRDKDDWNFKWEVSQKFGRSITHVEFTFSKKQQKDLFK
jgi:plasmid replication initiation protein